MITVQKLNLEKIEEEIKKPDFELLLKDGYEIAAYIPVIDESKPILVVVLIKREKTEDTNELSIINTILPKAESIDLTLAKINNREVVFQILVIGVLIVNLIPYIF